MLNEQLLKTFFMFLLPACVLAQGGNNTTSPEPFARIQKPGEKELYIPGKVFRIPDGNNYKSDTSEFSYSRMVESKNIVVFWSKEFGQYPMTNPVEAKRFNVQDAVKELERFYDFYVNKLKLVIKGKSFTDQYKMILYVIGGNGATAFGGGTEDKIGILWTPAVRMSKAPVHWHMSSGILFNT